jgi:branched-chain amino acid transport system permease protein
MNTFKLKKEEDIITARIKFMIFCKNFFPYLSYKGKIICILMLLVLIILPVFLASYWVRLMTEIAIASLFALSLNMLYGYSGMISLGHSAYFALGAYTAALLITKAHWGMPESFTVAAFTAGVGALIFGLICIRRTGVYFIMLTMATAMVLHSVIFKWYNFTGGENGIIGVSPSSLIASPLRYYYFTLFISFLAGYSIYRIVNSPFSYALKAIRDNLPRAESIGINAQRYRLMVFIMAGFFAGIAGALCAFFNGGAFPSYAFWLKSADPFIAIILGGSFYFGGPIVGATIMTLLQTFLTRYIEYWMVILGLIMVFLVMFLRKGLVDTYEERKKDEGIVNRIGEGSPKVGGGNKVL